MDIEKLAAEFEALAQALPTDSEAYKLLLFIDKLPSHCIYEDEIQPEQLEDIKRLERARYLMYVPDGHGVVADRRTFIKSVVPVNSESPRYRARYVVTSRGSHGLDTFKFDTLRDEL